MQNWITENVAFMSDSKLELKINHPYKRGNAKFQHIEETTFKMDSYSFLMRPISWTLKDNANEKQKYDNFYFKYAKKYPDFDVSSVTLFESAGFRSEISYAAEWVSYDAAIDVLNQAKTALKNIA